MLRLPHSVPVATLAALMLLTVAVSKGHAYYPYSSYLTGSAAVIDAQGQYALAYQQAQLLREQAKQARIETRRRRFDEQQYERSRTPTWQERRERWQQSQLRRAQTNPPHDEIWSGKSLNDLLADLQRLNALGVRGPDTPLSSDVLKEINVTSGRGGNFGILKGGRLPWPLALQGHQFEEDRELLDSLVRQVLDPSSQKDRDGDAVMALVNATERLTAKLRGNVETMPMSQYIPAKRFLRQLGDALQVLQQPNADRYITGVYAARGKSVQELVRHMSAHGLQFAPAVDGDQEAYTVLYRVLADHDVQLHAATEASEFRTVSGRGLAVTAPRPRKP
ncbi:MAG TPA: hypothetical protein VG013_34510 [Gemmataceae bacterium]|nr:hypothetical protein [Gemmataceae bacterium]